MLVTSAWLTPAYGRLLNLNGEVSINYNLTASGSSVFHSHTSYLQESVRVGTGGEVFREALGRYSLSFTFINDDRDHTSAGGSGKEHRQILNYFASLNLLPRFSPLSLTAQQSTQDIEQTGMTSKTTTTNYNLTWLAPRIWKLPQLQTNLFQSIFETQGQTRRIYGGSISASDNYPYRYVIRNTRLSWSISFSSAQRINDTGTRLNVGARVTADSTWTPALKTNARIGYTTGLSLQTPSVPGGVAQAKTAGVSAFYKPSLRFRAETGYDYSVDVYARHIGSFQTFYRPDPKFDIRSDTRVLFNDLDGAALFSAFQSGLVVYRPVLNVTTNLSATIGLNQTSGVNCPPPGPSTPPCANRILTLFQTYGVTANYFKVLELMRLNLSMGTSYSANIGNVYGNSNNFSAHWSAEAMNTKTTYVTTTGSYGGYYNRQSEGANTEQWTNILRLSATSGYFRELLLRGDRVTLHLGVADSITNSGFDNSQVVSMTTTASYAWRVVVLSSGFVELITTRRTGDYQSYFGEGRVNLNLWRQLSADFSARYDEQFNADSATLRRMLGEAEFNYQLGKVRLSARYQYSYTDHGTTTQLHNIYVRLSRPFSL